jgi:ferrochelatase
MTEKSPKTAVLLINLGSPDEPTASALKHYLREFLSDRRVVDLNPIFWQTLLNLVILPRRSPKSAARYAQVWMKEGAPLKVYTDRIADKLRQRLQEKAVDADVFVGMRYGNPSQVEVFKAIHNEHGFDRVLFLPLYPQYSSSTTASVSDAVSKAMQQMKSHPKVRFIRDYHTHPLYIKALADQIREHWAKVGPLGEKDRLMLSFHGMPVRYCREGDPYPKQVRATADLLIKELGADPTKVVLSYQSRFGKEEWLKPYSDDTVRELVGEGIERLDVICPGFHTDCLETIEEIGLELKETWQKAGGQSFHYIPCLNDSEASVSLVESIVEDELRHWPE